MREEEENKKIDNRMHGRKIELIFIRSPSFYRESQRDKYHYG